jgi:hypothetical protein
MKHGRWLQRDPKGYVDGPNLYEAFGGNALVNVDPEGQGILDFLRRLREKVCGTRERCLNSDAFRQHFRQVHPRTKEEFWAAFQNDLLRDRGRPERDFYAEIQAEAMRVGLMTALSEYEAIERISTITKHAGGFNLALSSGLFSFSGEMVKIAMTNGSGSEIIAYQLVPLDLYALNWEAERIRAAMPEHNCAGMDATQFGLAFVPGPGAPTSALAGVMHSGLHAWYGDDTGAAIRLMTAPLALAAPAEAATGGLGGMRLADEALSVSAGAGPNAVAAEGSSLLKLPGSQGVAVGARRLSTGQMLSLTQEWQVEFSLVYRTGSGRSGGGGTYWLYSGSKNQVMVPVGKDVRWIYHTHPGGTPYASIPDKNVLLRLQETGSPQRSSQVLPLGGSGPVRFKPQ